jgi:hypothetical protein
MPVVITCVFQHVGMVTTVYLLWPVIICYCVGFSATALCNFSCVLMSITFPVGLRGIGHYVISYVLCLYVLFKCIMLAVSCIVAVSAQRSPRARIG